jgi:diguanylate cyclase (GGDEF)-like protein/PAS domain S-box-containing protein
VQRLFPHRIPHAWLVACAVFLITAAAAAGLIWHSETQRQSEARTRVADLAGDHAQALQRGIERALSATYALAALVRQGNGSVRDFEAVGTQMLSFYPGIAVLGLAPDGIIRQVVPIAGNERSIGFNQLQDIAQNREALLARDTGKLTLAGPLQLVQGGLGVVGRLPVYLDDMLGHPQFWGFSYVTIRFPQALEAARLPQLAERGYAYALWRVVPDTGTRQTIATSSAAGPIDPVERTLALPNGTWTLSVSPTEGWDEPLQLLLKSILGLFVSCLMAYLAKVLIDLKVHEKGLEALVAERTAEILATQRQLELTAKVFEQSNEGIMITDAQRNIMQVNRAFTQITGYRQDEVLGKLPRLAGPGRMDDAFFLDMVETLRNQSHWEGETRNRRKDGTAYPQWLSITRVTDAQEQVTHYIAIIRDITQAKEAQDRIRQLAHYDPLTGLPNRTLLADRSDHAISIAQRSGASLALIFLDLDHFKNVNDSLGHRVGDELLKALAQRLRSVVREQDTISRLGGDEFILVLPSTDADGAAHVAGKLLEIAAQPYTLERHELTITPSIGIALFPADGADFDTLSKCADAAMYRAKQDGRNTYRFFTPEMQARSDRTLQVENALRRALERNQFELHYQPQIALDSGQVVGAEALLRWRHPDLGMVSPGEFIPIAENNGLILPIGEWVLRTATAQLKAWMNEGLTAMTVAVNLSAVQFRHAQLPELVTRILDEAQLPAAYLELELTEGAAMDDPRAAIAMMDNLHERGIRMSIDDFGTGYSSLSYLKRFQIYKLKIDQTFVRDITVDPEDKAIVSAIISMAGALGMLTIAEGVETEGQLAFLREQGCREGQGYLFSKPLPAAEFVRFLRKTCKP